MKIKYTIIYVFVDCDSEKRSMSCFSNWKDACAFMKSLLDDGYIILEVNG